MKLSSDTIRMSFGYILVVFLCVLGGVTALGSVKEADSFGYKEIVIGLLQVLMLWATWAFKHKKSKKSPKSKSPETDSTSPDATIGSAC